MSTPVVLPKWKRKFSHVAEKPKLSQLGQCLLELFASGTSVLALT